MLQLVRDSVRFFSDMNKFAIVMFKLLVIFGLVFCNKIDGHDSKDDSMIKSDTEDVPDLNSRTFRHSDNYRHNPYNFGPPGFGSRRSNPYYGLPPHGPPFPGQQGYGPYGYKPFPRPYDGFRPNRPHGGNRYHNYHHGHGHGYGDRFGHGNGHGHGRPHGNYHENNDSDYEDSSEERDPCTTSSRPPVPPTQVTQPSTGKPTSRKPTPPKPVVTEPVTQKPFPTQPPFTSMETSTSTEFPSIDIRFGEKE